jgi:fluoride exporter
MFNLFIVMLGGALGAGARYGTGLAMSFWLGKTLPFGTFAANIAGGFIMGALAAWLLKQGANGEPWRLFIGVGILGGYTTFSSFSLELFQMLSRGAWGVALGYALLSVCAALIMLALGFALARVAL